MNKISYCLCHEARVIFCPITRYSYMQHHEVYLTFVFQSLSNQLDLKFAKLMSCLSGKETMLDYVSDVLSVMQRYMVLYNVKCDCA